METHLFKLVHGEHLLGELQDQILLQRAAEYLVSRWEGDEADFKTERGTGTLRF